MKQFLSLAIIGALTALAFPGQPADLSAQSLASTQPPVSTNPEIAALQAQTAILGKQMAILNAKLDAILAKFPPSTPTSLPKAPEVLAAPAQVQANPAAWQPEQFSACALPQTTVSLMAGACGSGAASAGDFSADACGASSGQRQFRTPVRSLFRRIFRRGAAGAGCGG